jgi:mono/diheme cytochrome c family protein
MLFALSTESEIALALMGGIFIIFSLVSSFLLPRRNPDFPGKKWRNAYVVLCVALFVGMMSTVIVFGKEDEEAHAEQVATENPTDTTSMETTPTETETVTNEVETTETVTTEGEQTDTVTTEAETTETETMPAETTPTETKRAAGPYDNGDAAAGEAVFTSSGCGACHVLAAAGATGAVGPNLDEAKPDEALIVDRVVNGKGAMPPFKSQLTDQQIADVVAFVYQSTQS